ncbi:membrane protein insertase YidC [Sphingosinicella sp. BN140058]|uniref:membrane protein insertase YidC n=1 Tax=Sphingosinicella sp. BN140058 TaxID=1892855 RepID=UPI0010111DFC|nr:membrane protein insertase YidC [Sphingosinicella sp. BN140058]QAY78889.1 membrane protein insertase YidC [Sphingosinicella sp. BN140058]
MDDKRNIVLFVLLSALILVGWTFVADRWFPSNPPSTKTVNGKQVPVARPGTDPTADTPAAVRSRQTVLAETPRIAIETPRLKGSINLKGAQIDDLVLTQHTETIEKNSPPVRLLSPAGAPESYFARFGWGGEGVKAPDANTVWTASGTRLAPGSPVRLSWDNGQGQTFEMTISVDDGYMFTVDQRVANRAAGAVAVRPYSLVSRASASKDPTAWTNHVGPVGVFDGKANYDWDYTDLTPGARQPFATTGGWLGFGDKYWLTALVPDQRAPVETAFTRGQSGSFQADVQGQPTIVNAGRAVGVQTRFFAGAKEIELLEHYQDDLGVARFEKAIDWGWFEWFMRPIFKLLRWLYATIGNFGFAIIGLTMIVRALMFPIAQKQFKSMASMRVLQPKMKALQERHKEDKPRLQQEMLKLYQEEKVNPMAGCLPILIQIPIFYALYKTLTVAVEMRHKPFVLWIKDLSAPDPLTPVNLFGFLDFTPPHFLALGVLPILLGITMWLQFKLNPPQADPVQQQVFGLMPWVMMFIMAPFAAGLQLYWTVNNILTILQQKWLYSRHPGMKAAAPVAEAK